MTYFSETVTISSDEEETESETSSQPATPKPATPKPQAGNEVSSSPSQTSQTSNNSTEPMESPIIPTIPISSKVDNKPRVDKMEDEVCIHFRFVKFYSRSELCVLLILLI